MYENNFKWKRLMGMEKDIAFPLVNKKILLSLFIIKTTINIIYWYWQTGW